MKTPLLAAVGPLQFEVVQYRLESEYGAESRLEATPWTVVRWLPMDMKEDGSGRPVIADRLPYRVRRGEKSRRPVPQRMVGGLFYQNK